MSRVDAVRYPAEAVEHRTVLDLEPDTAAASKAAGLSVRERFGHHLGCGVKVISRSASFEAASR
jgi:hypothetical protein